MGWTDDKLVHVRYKSANVTLYDGWKITAEAILGYLDTLFYLLWVLGPSILLILCQTSPPCWANWSTWGEPLDHSYVNKKNLAGLACGSRQHS